MTNLQPYFEITTQHVFDRKVSQNVNLILHWDDFSKNDILIDYTYDEFHFPSLSSLKKEFEESGLYDLKQIDAIMKIYGRLPQYKSKSKNTSGS